MTCPRPDVRCEQSRGAELGGKPKTLLFHPGASGEGKIGRVKSFEPLVMLRQAEPRIGGCCGGVQGHVAEMRHALAGERLRSG
jgi:hypothetical protein